MPREQEPYHEFDTNLIAAYTATFIPRTDVYPLQLEDGRYISIKHTLYPDLVVAHFKGLITIGAYALDSEHRAKWLCFDADTHEQWERFLEFSDVLEAQAVPSYREPSRRGGHLWLFFPLLRGSEARRLGKQLIADYELPTVEIYPKQDELRTGTGSFVRLPLGKHRLTGRRYHFINRAGEPLALTIRQQIMLLAQPQHIPQAFIEEVLSHAAEVKHVSPTPPFHEPKPTKKYKRRITGELPSERIKATVSVYAFVSQYVNLDAQGRGFCPFHADEHMSFGVSQDGNYWHCFAGCGGGSVIDFWMKWREKNGEEGSFKATIADLADRLLD